MADRAQAKAEVLNISRKFGFVGDDIMAEIEAWRPDIRRLIEESMLAKDTLAAHSIKTLAQNIYGSDARFVFELLQNADDNRFTRAQANGNLPFISFQVYPNRIIVECNEDGFTGNDLLAICSVGESTKSGSHGYIGAKGIGFKSVFIAARKVYIQSGNFSFYFKHDRGDLGLGMVLPIWEETDEELPQPLTRMTLHLHEKGDQAELKHLRDTIFKQLNDLQQTCMLFLRNLRQIRVSFYDEDGELENSREFDVGNLDNHRVFLETSSTDGEGEVTVEKKHYHVTRNTVYGISKSNNRELPNTEEGNQASSTTEVILAFPLTGDSKPSTEKQQLFAFLPVRMSDFKFIIQCDFDTSANRQEIVTTSKRNIDLLDGIADTFVKAVLQFCEHADLCYSWPSFLPLEEDGSSSSFWAGLMPKIKSRLSEIPALRSRHRSHPRLIRDVRILASEAADGNEDPLFEDPSKDLFISKAYPYASWSVLRKYGLKVMNFDEMVDGLEADLKSSTSKMKSKSTNEEWHSRVAKVLTKMFERSQTSSIRRMKGMSLLPLWSGLWVSANDGAVYLPTTNGIPIPPAISLPILHPESVVNQDRKALFILLGAVEPQITTVKDCILDAYTRSSTQIISVTDSKSHLHYLYLTHLPGQNPLKNINIFASSGEFRNPQIHDFYLPSSHAYGPEALLQPTSDAPGLPVKFIHPTYLEDKPNAPSSSHPTWSKWLQDTLGVREKLRLVSRQGDSLSDTWDYVREYRREKLLGFLECLWKYEGSKIVGNQSLIDQIKRTWGKGLCIPAIEGDDEDEWEEAEDDVLVIWSFEHTWLPLPDLQTQRSRYLQENEFFPFLALEGSDTMSPEQISAKWAFLHKIFSVGKDENISFLLAILRSIYSSTYGRARSVTRPERIVNLYIAIDAKCTVAIDRGEERDLIRNFIDSEKGYLFIPPHRGSSAKWSKLESVVWDGPPGTRQFTSLKHAYEELLGPGSDQIALLSRFFQRTLSVKAETWAQITREIQYLRSRPALCDLDHVYGLYEYLSTLNIIAFPQDLRKSFEEHEMIFVPKNGQPSWHKSVDCLWSSTADIRGKVVLNDHYEDLRDFFIDKIGVQTLTLEMIYDELIQVHHHERTVDDIKNVIWSFNSLLQTEPAERHQLDPHPLLAARVFAVKYPEGGKRLVSAAETEFAIIDRDSMAARFEDKIKLLDYTLAEVRQLKPFLEWANLEHRYLSRSVKDITSVSSGALSRNVSASKRDVKRRAYALLRIAATFGSPRYESDPQDLYRLLRTTQVIETSGISRISTISQNGHAVQTEEPVAGDVHMSEENDTLSIYVPINRKLQEFSFGSLLPARFADWLMRDSTTQIISGSGMSRGKVDSTMVNALATILALDVSAVDLILDHQGIIKIPIDNQDIIEDDSEGGDDEQEEGQEGEVEVKEVEQRVTECWNCGKVGVCDCKEESDHSSDVLSSTLAASTPGIATPTTELGEASPSPLIIHTITQQSHMVSASHRPQIPTSSHIGSHSGPPPQQAIEDRQYRALLQRVTTAARSAAFPSRGSFDMSSLLNNLPSLSSNNFTSFDGLETLNRFRSSSQLERDKKIGAAGELYVFELLSQLLSEPGDQNNFDRSNWQSTIRRYIADYHPDYADLLPWNGRETADFTFDDTSCRLKNLLRDNGYLNNSAINTNTIGQVTKFFIEVKTTSGPCGTPFYMSRGQYQRMRDIHAANHQQSHPREVYIILRVFSIESTRPGMCVYFDPEELRVGGGLVFTGETWSVVPGR
ncbi:hypothetical protein QBC37DRAFT_391255 [Rhypophila decipiens]|uniref:Protein NO VEIN C-terminal domain-containing protein n=1 Tax=Rhypophila decipiens TaxID=261697 RepID=A0AAN6Y166_9PEZI|nr:hypothetical protein QBC37DRAFT_391255 [Rhypophila decipiens]